MRLKNAVLKVVTVWYPLDSPWYETGRYLSLANNKFSGMIPDILGTLVELQYDA